MSTNQNERSQAIDLISEINLYLSRVSISIKKAGGETTIRNNNKIKGKIRKVMFPDVLLYSDMNKNELIQGWELKLPDVLTTDGIYIADAQYKADVLGLQSTVLWNFNTIVLYVKNGNNWEIYKQWNDLSFIKNRDDVNRYRKKWIDFLQEFLLELDSFFSLGVIQKRNLVEITDQVTNRIVNDNKKIVANYMKKQVKSDRRISIFIDVWWKTAKQEFLKDEDDSYEAYAKVILLGWVIRIIFTHLIKKYHVKAREIDLIGENSDPKELNCLFSEITISSDFYTIFENKKYDELIPEYTWDYILEFNSFLGDKIIEHEMLQSILEESVNQYKREVTGQYTTPEKLAELLVNITILNIEGNDMDPCCGTGIIPKKIIDLKESLGISEIKAHNSTWASDKMQMPLQITNMSLTTPTSMNVLNKVFQQNVFDLRVNQRLDFRSPVDGNMFECIVPKFKNIVSNLPFVPFEILDIEDKEKINLLRNQLEIDSFQQCTLSDRSDYYSYILLKLYQLLDDNGRVGVVISNSWLGTESGKQLYKALLVYYKIQTVVISGKGRWFKNAKVVTSLLILEKKGLQSINSLETKFVMIEELIENISSQQIREITNSIITDEKISLLSVSSYTESEIKLLIKDYLSINSLFYDVYWFDEALQENLTKLTNYFTVIRGMRRGWDALFYPSEENNIESDYLQPILMNSKNIKSINIQPDQLAFCCSKSIEELQELNHRGALSWIKRYESGLNKTGIPLTEVLRKKNLKWYEMKKDGSIAEFVTSISPNKRLFWATLTEASFINQRLVGIIRNENAHQFPKDLFSALLNSIISLFFIEASGFGRGEGVLDLNKSNLEKTWILDPVKLSVSQINEIIDKYNNLSFSIQDDIRNQLETNERVEYDKFILNCYGIKDKYECIKSSLFKMIEVRLSVRE